MEDAIEQSSRSKAISVASPTKGGKKLEKNAFKPVAIRFIAGQTIFDCQIKLKAITANKAKRIYLIVDAMTCNVCDTWPRPVNYFKNGPWNLCPIIELYMAISYIFSYRNRIILCH
jgi:hypothetical protein